MADILAEPTPGELQDTSDLNVAAFIKRVKDIPTAGHYFAGDQLRIRFRITADQLAAFKEEYLNSVFMLYDATKRNFLRLLKKRG